MTIKNKFRIKQQVFLITDPDQQPRFVTGITVRDNDLIVYHLTGCIEDSDHYEFEISNTKNYNFGTIKDEA